MFRFACRTKRISKWPKRCVKDYEDGFVVLSILDNVPAWGEIARNEFFGPNFEPGG